MSPPEWLRHEVGANIDIKERTEVPYDATMAPKSFRGDVECLIAENS